MEPFRNQVVAITGAGSGIGRALAVLAARDGCTVALCDVNEDGLRETVHEVEACGASATHARVDVSKRDAVERFAKEAIAAHGHVDVIVNNAGVALTVSVAEMSYEDFEWLMGINFWGVVFGTKAFLPQMLARKTGHIVNVSSIFGMIGVPSQSAYNAAKFAVRGFTESLRGELFGTGVHAHTVHPGGIQTNILRSSRFVSSALSASKEQLASDFERFLARTSAENCAKTIVRGVRRGRERILVGADARWIDRIARVTPEKYVSLFHHLQARFAKTKRS